MNLPGNANGFVDDGSIPRAGDLEKYLGLEEVSGSNSPVKRWDPLGLKWRPSMVQSVRLFEQLEKAVS